MFAFLGKITEDWREKAVWEYFFETDAVLINYNLDVSSGFTALGVFHKSNNSD